MSVEAYRTLLDRLGEPYLLVSGTGTILGANRRLARLGLGDDGLVGRPLAELSAGPAGEVEAYIRRCSRTASPLPGSLTLKAADGRPIQCRADGCALEPSAEPENSVVLLRLAPRDASVAQFLALNQKIDELAREIARRKRVEEDLRDQKEWLGVTLSSIGDAVIATDTEGRVIFMNPVAEALTGWPQAEASGLPLEQVFRIVNEDSREPVENPVAKCLRDGKIVGLANHTVLLARDGAESSIDDTAAPIRGPDGRVRGVVLVFHDDGNRRRMERELHARAERLAENDRRKNEFLAMLAHELRNPLSSINNAIRLLGQLESEDALEWARDVTQRQVKHLTRLIDDLLDVSRISRGKIALRKEPLDLAPVIAGAVEAVRPLVEDRKHDLRVGPVDDGLRVEADPLRLEQILINLLTNAAKYSPSGGRIALEARREGGQVVIAVEDSGMGIPPELLPQVFELFVQGDRTIARSEGGLGIGLTLVRRLAEMHGGGVSAASEGAGKGSVFTVRLPALAPDRPAPARRDPRRPAPGGARPPARVLVVDDNVDNARGIARLLRLLGHDVRMAHDGAEAIEVAQGHRPQVVLLDIGLPGMDGYEVVRRLRENDCCRSALIVAVSGYGQPDDLRRSREAGFDDHLVKPVDFDALTALIASRPDQA